jgi:23S rRNA maturation mini-RNase III
MSKYQGMTNFETFIVSLWLNNEKEHLSFLTDLARSTRNDKVITLKSYIEEQIEKTIPAKQQTHILNNAWFVLDLVAHCLDSQVNYLEILALAREE